MYIATERTARVIQNASHAEWAKEIEIAIMFYGLPDTISSYVVERHSPYWFTCTALEWEKPSTNVNTVNSPEHVVTVTHRLTRIISRYP